MALRFRFSINAFVRTLIVAVTKNTRNDSSRPGRSCGYILNPMTHDKQICELHTSQTFQQLDHLTNPTPSGSFVRVVGTSTLRDILRPPFWHLIGFIHDDVPPEYFHGAQDVEQMGVNRRGVGHGTMKLNYTQSLVFLNRATTRGEIDGGCALSYQKDLPLV